MADEIPDDLKYTAEHEWVRLTGENTVRVGITHFAQKALGDVVYVSAPQVDTTVTRGAAFGEVESTKSVSDLYAPVTGTVTARNEMLDEHPELINEQPYGEGWIVELRVADASALNDLLDAAAYGTLAQ